MMAEQLTKQLQLKRLIDRSLENFRKIGKPKLTPAKVRARIAVLKETWQQFLDGHAVLLKVTPESIRATVEYFTDGSFEETANAFDETHDYMYECLEKLEPVSHAQGVSNAPYSAKANAFSLSHLPTIQLPPFSGNYEDWESFRDRFTALIIKNPDLDNFSRMHFLTSCVKGRALESIGNLDITAENFPIAWDSLIARFENKRRLLTLHLSTLLNLAPLTREAACDLQQLSDKVNIAVASLKKLPRSPDELWNDILVHIVGQRLDPVTRKAWNVKSSDHDLPPSYEDLDRFLGSRIRAIEDFNRVSSVKSSSRTTAESKVHAATASSSAQSSCPLCKARHYVNTCPVFVRASPNRRRELVKQHRRCYNCLSQHHSVQECSSKYTCRICSQKHHTMLHSGSGLLAKGPDTSPTLDASSRTNEAPTAVQTLLSAQLVTPARSHVLLATAWVTVSSSSGRSVVIRALLDQGSEVSFLSENVAQVLRAKRSRQPVTVSAVGCVSAGTCQHSTQVSVSPRDSLSPSFLTSALILKNLTSYAPKQVLNIATYPHLAGLHWADPDPTGSEPIQMILGADIYNEVVLEGRRKGDIGEPTAQNSIFGWFISGPVTRSHELPRDKLVAVHHSCSSSSLEEALKKFWEIEELPREEILTEDDEKCEKHFNSTHSRASNGRYIVRIPFKRDPPIDIGHSRFKAEKLYESLIRRMRSSPETSNEYSSFLAEYERLGHMRRAPLNEEKGKQYVYIPHHPVVRSSSVTTHLRVVFNASSPTSNGSSLNDHMYAGPKLQTDLPSILLHWRRYRFVYTADIAKMYRQIMVDSRDINYQRILWKDNSISAPVSYQLLTVTYGMACAPFLALRVLRQLVVDDGARFPLAVPILNSHIYVDDLLFGADDLSQLRRIRNQLISLLRGGGFELRKWASNSSLLLSDIDPADHGLACTKSLAVDEQVKILGIEWNPALDVFQFRVSLTSQAPDNKRSILSAIAKIYDPLGWVTPVTIAAKIFMQQLWRENLGWDDDLSNPLLGQWQSIYCELSCLNGLRFPRWTGLVGNAQQTQLHGFSDASNSAYSAVIYLRVIDSSGKPSVTLLAGKSKVAPLKPLSVPRLELSAAVLLARLMTFVRDALDMRDSTCFCWTDSTIVLAWLKRSPSHWKTFVANRVALVQARLSGVEWRHVPTEDNPADCASRGLIGSEILAHPLWWQGPSWLQLSQNQWPQQRSCLPADVSSEEKTIVVHTAQNQNSVDLAARYSSWPKLLRITAYVFRFINRCRRIQTASSIDISTFAISAGEYCTARTFWIKYIQAAVFSNDLHALRQGRELPLSSKLSSLRPFLDSEDVLRVGGRLRNAPIPVSTRHPILLASHPLVLLIVEQAHQRALHAGVQLTLATLRREFWILHSRSIVKSIIHRCVICVREKAAVPSQLMGDLPAVRVTTPPRAFAHSGVDYAGPVHVRASAGRGIASRKAYIALFVCLSTRAIHLELVTDYSASAFLNAFSRFCARRGLPQSVYSDNGTNFVGADRELAIAYRAALRDPNVLNHVASDQVTWKFIPPSAPHFGGLWEAGIRSVKHHLRRIIGNHTLTFEEFCTLLCKVEACLNSRPIAPLSDSLDDYEPLTPGHFLIGSAITTNPEPSLLDINENRLSRWQLVRQLSERFWKLWSQDYVNTLQQRSKWRREQSSLGPGQLVLIQNPLLPPCKWDLGRVTHCHPGADGLTRVVTVKTATSVFKRPIVKLCVLPINSDCATP